ncbi:MAG TPA: enoyl-CoA hydratase-related protein, partial [Microthrixaceae bacterium]|nr:enoyl-CoA hydratase-related protein [Microthrixaceae bacterium]
MPTCFDLSISDAVAHLRLCRPDDLNTMTAEFWSELPELVAQIDAAASARVIVISSTGKHFSAGMDLSVFSGAGGLLGDSGVSEAGRQRAHLWSTVQRLQQTFSILEQVRMPVLAAVQGGCIGGAVD